MPISVDVLKLTALVIVGGGAFLLIYQSDKQAGAALLGAILGYVFGNAHGLYEAKRRS